MAKKGFDGPKENAAHLGRDHVLEQLALKMRKIGESLTSGWLLYSPELCGPVKPHSGCPTLQADSASEARALRS